MVIFPPSAENNSDFDPLLRGKTSTLVKAMYPTTFLFPFWFVELLLHQPLLSHRLSPPGILFARALPTTHRPTCGEICLTPLTTYYDL